MVTIYLSGNHFYWVFLEDAGRANMNDYYCINVDALTNNFTIPTSVSVEMSSANPEPKIVRRRFLTTSGICGIRLKEKNLNSAKVTILSTLDQRSMSKSLTVSWNNIILT